ncbi:MAG: hypothetical protein PPHEMADMSA_6422 [uncultured Paraburkholderia sp.]|nr:MAG: hypothetical protein PPHEMADMSA_6422 [uncultured Paraburkholderia sp.]
MLAMERRHLRLAEHHLARAALLIRQQEHRVIAVEAAGFDAEPSRYLLALMRETRLLMQEHRRQILAAIERLSWKQEPHEK